MKNKGRKEFIDYLNRDQHDWFYKLFIIERITIEGRNIKNDSERLLVQVRELKALLDCLEQKGT